MRCCVLSVNYRGHAVHTGNEIRSVRRQSHHPAGPMMHCGQSSGDKCWALCVCVCPGVLPEINEDFFYLLLWSSSSVFKTNRMWTILNSRFIHRINPCDDPKSVHSIILLFYFRFLVIKSLRGTEIVIFSILPASIYRGFTFETLGCKYSNSRKQVMPFLHFLILVCKGLIVFSDCRNSDTEWNDLQAAAPGNSFLRHGHHGWDTEPDSPVLCTGELSYDPV